MRDTVSEIKDRLSILDVVGGSVKLKKAGRSYVGLCPFHKEKTPSFHVSPERGTYHCFGCGEGGDIFSFIEKSEGVDFKGALTLLAERAGVPLEQYSGRDAHAKGRQERLREAMAQAAAFYAGLLTEDSAAYRYTLSRGLSPETVRAWGLGFGPDSWRTLLEYLVSAGFTNEELLAAGLIKEADGKPGTYYDRFRNRLMFPIRDVVGRVVAFTGRALSTDEPAKYLNSPETELYRKSEILFGMDKAKDAIRQRGFVLLVEGQMDALLAHQTGFANAVALSGTALTAKHLALMKRYSENLLLCLDADAAGLSATASSARLALSLGLRVKAARLPSGEDPADLISGDPQAFAACVKEAKPVAEFFLAVLAEREKDPHRRILAAERIVLPLIAAVRSPLEREHFLMLAARALGLSEGAVRESLARAPLTEPEAEAVSAGEAPRAPARDTVLAAVVQAYQGTALARRVADEYARIVGAAHEPAAADEAALFFAEQSLGENPGEHDADDLVRAFEETHVREAYQEALGQLRRAEAAGDAAGVKSAEALCQALSERLAGLHK